MEVIFVDQQFDGYASMQSQRKQNGTVEKIVGSIVIIMVKWYSDSGGTSENHSLVM